MDVFPVLPEQGSLYSEQPVLCWILGPPAGTVRQEGNQQ